jgi:Fe2+ transport system protein FeoA
MDKNHTRSINFYCHMSKSANRKLAGMGIHEGCPFRLIFKLKNVDKIISDETQESE